jgi:hypothetical protein
MSPASALPSNLPHDRRFVASRPSASKSAGRYRPSPNDFIASFYAVLNRWKSETAFESDPDSITGHPSFAALVANAENVCPLIIEELRTSPSMLVWVLDDAFPDAKPYSSDAVGDFMAMANGWISWAERNGRAL